MQSRSFSDATVGEPLPTLAVELTRTLIMAGAVASRDYQEVHHDSELARERGSKDIIMNILTTNGFVGRFVTDWAGPDAIIRSVKVRLGAPNYPGDTMTMTGAVTELRAEGNIAVIAVRGANSLGDHVNATVEVTLP
ncbi:MAG TPA: MaoC family dehydratase [Ilumatobacteraceae bacterium]|nr:MaoC family dehydratase [Ilumatobacteraceae bacterium]